MSKPSTPRAEARRTASRQKPAAGHATAEGPKSIAGIKRLRVLVEGPEPLWPIPAPDSKKVTNLD